MNLKEIEEKQSERINQVMLDENWRNLLDLAYLAGLAVPIIVKHLKKIKKSRKSPYLIQTRTNYKTKRETIEYRMLDKKKYNEAFELWLQGKPKRKTKGVKNGS
ncbi:MAG: hypothetical protein EB078_03845 [Proteobacteria bacterium]|nr:hypothetical protein [Pseudomonadota bacterium]NDD04016.1 hypothetical protein [Pseudomonadota bacterium]